MGMLRHTMKAPSCWGFGAMSELYKPRGYPRAIGYAPRGRLSFYVTGLHLRTLSPDSVRLSQPLSGSAAASGRLLYSGYRVSIWVPCSVTVAQRGPRVSEGIEG